MRRPWFFDNQLLIAHQWHPHLKGSDPYFKHAQLWVQVRDLPYHWCSKEVGWKLGKLFPKCLNVIIPENGSKEGSLLKLLIELNLNIPLLRGTALKLTQEVHCVDFKYEQLPSYFTAGSLDIKRGCVTQSILIQVQILFLRINMGIGRNTMEDMRWGSR